MKPFMLGALLLLNACGASLAASSSTLREVCDVMFETLDDQHEAGELTDEQLLNLVGATEESCLFLNRKILDGVGDEDE